MNDDIKIIDSDAARLLRDFVGRIETLEREKKGLMEDIREVFKEAKEQNFDVKTLREILKRRKLSEREIQEQEYLIEAYTAALEKKAGLDASAAEDDDEAA